MPLVRKFACRKSVPVFPDPRPPKYCKNKVMNKHITYSRYTYSTPKYILIQDIQKAI